MFKKLRLRIEPSWHNEPVEEIKLFARWMERAVVIGSSLPGSLFLEKRDGRAKLRRYRLEYDRKPQGYLVWLFVDDRWRLTKVGYPARNTDKEYK